MKDVPRDSRRFSRIAALAVGSLAALAAGCSPTPLPHPDPVGEPFPEVAGEALDGESWRIPRDLAGKPAILLIGFVQDSQFGRRTGGRPPLRPRRAQPGGYRPVSSVV